MTEMREGKTAIAESRHTDANPADSSSANTELFPEPVQKKTFRERLKEVVWDTFDYSPEERIFISKIDFFILCA